MNAMNNFIPLILLMAIISGCYDSGKGSTLLNATPQPGSILELEYAGVWHSISNGSHIGFDKTVVGASQTHNLRLHNCGNTAVVVTGISSNDTINFDVIASTPATLYPGQDLNITVTFQPTAVATFSGTITLFTTDPFALNYTFYVEGEGN